MNLVPLLLCLYLLGAFTFGDSLALVVIEKRGKTHSFDLNKPATTGIDLNKKPSASKIDLNKPASSGGSRSKSGSGGTGSTVGTSQRSTLTSAKTPASSSSVRGGKGKAPSTSGGVRKTPQSQLDAVRRYKTKPENLEKVRAWSRKSYHKAKAAKKAG